MKKRDETVFWLGLLLACAIVPPRRLAPLMQEAEELLAIFAASQRTSRYGRKEFDRQ